MPADKNPPTDYALIMDTHTHLGNFRNFHIPDPHAEGLVRAMDTYGIDVAVLSSHAAISADFVLGNDETMAALEKFPDRLLGYCVINPNYSKLAAHEIERCFAHPGIRGFKFHPELHGNYPLDGPGYRAAWEYANEHKLPVLSHSYFAGDSADKFAEMAAAYRNAVVIIGHAGQDYRFDDVVRVVGSCPNIFLDLCGPLATAGYLEALVERVGASRLLFSTDMPFISGGPQLGAIVTSQLPRRVKELVLGGNAAPIFGLPGPRLLEPSASGAGQRRSWPAPDPEVAVGSQAGT